MKGLKFCRNPLATLTTACCRSPKCYHPWLLFRVDPSLILHYYLHSSKLKMHISQACEEAPKSVQSIGTARPVQSTIAQYQFRRQPKPQKPHQKLSNIHLARLLGTGGGYPGSKALQRCESPTVSVSASFSDSNATVGDECTVISEARTQETWIEWPVSRVKKH